MGKIKVDPGALQSNHRLGLESFSLSSGMTGNAEGAMGFCSVLWQPVLEPFRVVCKQKRMGMLEM